MKLQFLAVTSKSPPWLNEIAATYEKRLSYWMPTETRFLSSPKIPREGGGKKLIVESNALVNYFQPEDFVILCDEKGKNFSSLLFAKRLETILSGGKKRLVTVVGGAYGVGPEVQNRADLKLCLSPLTLNHHLALAVAMEQVYRAMTILKGISYHND